MRVNCAVAPYVFRYRCKVCGLNFLGGVEVVQLYADHTWTHIDLETLFPTSVTTPGMST